MSFTISPGIVTREIDLTSLVPVDRLSAAATVGSFQWGPVQEPTLVTSEDNLVSTFQKPNSVTYNSFFTAANILAYSNDLQVIRVANSSALNATTDSANALYISNSSNYYQSFDVTAGGSANNFYGDFVGKYPGTLGNSLKVSLCGADKASATLTGTVNVTAGSSNAHTITGSGTTFNTEVGVGDVIRINSNNYIVKTVTNSTQLLVSGHNEAAQASGNTATRLKRSAFSEPEGNMIGVVTVAAGNTSVTGTNTLFDLQINTGDILTINGQEVIVNSVTSNTALVLRSPITNAASTNVFSRKWEYNGNFDTAPTTSVFGTRKGTSQDEVHFIVIDEDGEWTGTKGQVLEAHANLSVASDAKFEDGTDQFYTDKINRTSKYVWWMDHNSAGDRDTSLNTIAWGAVANSSVAPQFQANATIITSSLTGGVDGNTPTTADLITGFDILKNSEQVDIDLIATGNASSTVCIHVINNIVDVRKDCMVFLSPEQADSVGLSGSQATDDIISFRDELPSSSYAVMDSGYKYQFDKFNDVFRYVPLNGDIVGIMARTQAERDFFFSPAGFNRGQVRNVVNLPFNPEKTFRDNLYKNGVNPVVSFPGQGTILFGDKTLLSKPSAFDRINVRRLFIALEKSISRFAQGQLFEFNDEFTRSRFVSTVEPFLRDIQGRGGITDFNVVCDTSNNTQEVIDRNEFVASIFVKPTRSINFILLNFVAVRSGVEFSEVTNVA